MANFITYCICQKCGVRFNVIEDIFHSVVLKPDTENYNNFFEGKFNLVYCKKCKSHFTFETKLVVYDKYNKLAIFVDPDDVETDEIPDILIQDGFSYRKVTYQIEAIEKENIFRDGLSDFDVEYIKLLSFTDNEATPFDRKNVVYQSSHDNIYTFHIVDYLNNVIDIRDIDISNINIEIPKHNIPKIWQKVNRYTIDNTN